MKYIPDFKEIATTAVIAVLAVSAVSHFLPAIGPLPSGKKILGLV